MNRLNQKGVGHVVAVVAAVVVLAVCLIGWKVMGNKNSTDNSATPAVANQTAVPATIKSKADLSKANQALNSTDVDGSVNPDSLNQDLNAL